MDECDDWLRDMRRTVFLGKRLKTHHAELWKPCLPRGLSIVARIAIMILVLCLTRSELIFARISFSASSNQAGYNVDDVPSEVLDNQPRLYIDSEDERRNDSPLAIGYCVHRNENATYYTYVYQWVFSDSPWVGQLLGYPDHEWDYEPVIVRVDRFTGQTRYIYDKGHYRAGMTESRDLEVEPGSHRFSPSNARAGRTFSAESFSQITRDQLDMLNQDLATLPRLPFGGDLSLDWACNDPSQVGRHSEFSTDSKASHIPVQVNGLGGGTVGAINLSSGYLLVIG